MAPFLLAGIFGYLFAQSLVQFQPWSSVARHFSNAHCFLGITSALFSIAVLGIGRKMANSRRARSKIGEAADSRRKSGGTWRYILATGVLITLFLIGGASSRRGKTVEDPLFWTTCCLAFGLCFTAAALVAQIAAPDNELDASGRG